MKKTLHTCFSTLLHSWGGDTPPEAIWAANDFLVYLTPQYPQLKGLEFLEDDIDGKNGEILEIIYSLN